jgi:peptidoglycan glycosyltransferase
MVANNYIKEPEALDAAQQDLVFAGQEVPINAPHFVFYVRHQLEEMSLPQFATLGYSIYTTIDLELQQTAQKLAAERIDTLKDRNIHNAAVVVLQPNTGQLLAMVGSVDYNRSEATTTKGFEGNVLDCQVNVATNLRQPGSALKPFTYISAMEQGMTPASILWDVQTTFPSNGSDRYEPKNYNGKWQPVRMRQSVANSLNMPAIEALKYAGIGNTIDLLHRAGITSLKRGEGFYGLALTLGGGEVTPLDLTTAYNTLASNGHYYPPVSILKVVNAAGQTISQYTPPVTTAAINPELVSIMADMMSDDNARAGVWGSTPSSNYPVLQPSKPVPQTTGVTRGQLDLPHMLLSGSGTAITIMNRTCDVESLTGGGMIWHNLMEYIFTNERLNNLLAEPYAGKLPINFTRAQGLQELPDLSFA